MGRLIDVDVALSLKDKDMNWVYDLTDLEEFLAGVPTVDAEPVRHGHIVWKERIVGGYKYAEVKCHNCGCVESVETEHPIKTKVAYCSECGERLDDTFMHYCPNCGARLDVE